jgi:hypothetical protein
MTTSSTGFKPEGATTAVLDVVTSQLLTGHPVSYAETNVGKMKPASLFKCGMY